MRVVRLILRLITTVLAISAVVFVLTGSFWYMWQYAKDQTPRVTFTITAGKLEQAVLGLYLRYRGSDVAQPAHPDDAREVTFVVEPGEAVTTVAQRLERMELVKDAELFRRVVQYWEADGDIQVGVYSLRPDMTMEEIMRELQRGRMPTIAVTIPEGWRMEQIAARLEEAGVTSAEGFVEAVNRGRTDYDFLLDRPQGSPISVEGFLFPDTYQLPLQTTPDRVIDIMLQNWGLRVPSELRQKTANTGMSLYEVVILASIVEREAVLADERPLIAGVFLSRLKKGMYLQADPTVIYAKGYSEETGRWWNPMIQEEAVTVDSPYNTFLNPGLPPSPLCNPGLGAIEAVLEPEPSEYLFFRAKGDDGSHVFAVTYEEHLRNQELYGEP